MFDIKKIIKRSWHILWNYRMLWVFGLFLALALGARNAGNNSRYTVSDEQQRQAETSTEVTRWEDLEGDTFGEKLLSAFNLMGGGLRELQAVYPEEFRLGAAAAITALAVMLIFGLGVAVLRYVAEGATIRMVDEYEQSGTRVGFRQGWGYGWTPAAWRLFGADFVVHLPVLAALVLLGLLVWWIAASFTAGSEWQIASALITSAGLAVLIIFVTVVVMAALLLVRDIAWRMIVLEGKPAMEGLRAAAALVRKEWQNVGLLWLVMVGISIAWSVVFMVLIFPLLVVSIVTLLPGVVAALAPTLLATWVASLLAAPTYWPWIFGGIVGLPLFLAVTFSPVLLVNGWSLIFHSSAWTLAYRELKTLQGVGKEGR